MSESGTSTEPTAATATAAALFAQMERAWNAADGAAFAEPFAAEIDFVDIRGTHHRGGPEVVGSGHQALFDSIYAGSTVRYSVDSARTVAPGCVVAVATSTLDAPSGPLQGIHRSTVTAVVTEHDGRWAVSAFHNTLVLEHA